MALPVFALLVVAEVLYTVLSSPNTVGRSFELLAGDTPIEKAVRGV